MKNKEVEAAIQQLHKALHPYLESKGKCIVTLSTEGDVEIGFISKRAVEGLSKVQRPIKVLLTDKQAEYITSLIRNPRLSDELVNEYISLIKYGRLTLKQAQQFIKKCEKYLSERSRAKSRQQNPNFNKPLS